MPDSAARVAQVWRRSYSRNFATLLAFTARSWALLTLGTGRSASVSHGNRKGVFKSCHAPARTFLAVVSKEPAAAPPSSYRRD